MNGFNYRIYTVPFSFIILSYLFYAHCLFFDFFIFDDYILRSPQIQNLTWENFFQPWQNSLTPISYNVWQLIAFFGGADTPAPFRLVNIIIHGLNSYYIFLIGTKLNDLFEVHLEKKFLYAFALLFLAHPVATESVIWPSAIRTLLSTFCSLAFFYHYLKNDLKLNYIALLSFAIGVLINPTAAGIIFIVPTVALILKKPISKTDFFGLVAFLLIFFPLHYAETISKDFFSLVSYYDRIMLTISALAKYMQICILPYNLSFDYQINPTNREVFKLSSLITNIIIILTFLVIPYLVLKEKVKPSFVLCLQLCFLFFISTNIGIFLHDFNNISVVANRYAYLALFPIMFLLVLLIQNFFHSFPRLQFFSFGLIFLALLSQTAKETLQWKSPEKLFSASINNSGENQEILIALGAAYMANENFRQAELIFLKTIDRYPLSIEPLLHIVELYLRTEDRQKIKNFLTINNIRSRPVPSASFLPIAKLYLLINDNHMASLFLDKHVEIYGQTKDSDLLQTRILDQ